MCGGFYFILFNHFSAVKMEIQRSFLAHYLFILTHFISAHSEIIIKNEKTVYALPGDYVTLTCSILKEKEIHITQTQWTMLADGPRRRLAVYNPLYGTEYPMAYNYSVSFRNGSHHCLADFNWTSSHSDSTTNHMECYQWILQLRNVSLELSGLYECSFTAFPTGTSSSETKLIIEKRGDKSSVVETLLNQTLEIPCFKGVPFVNAAALKWLLQKENGNEEILIINKTNPMIDRERIQMNSENTLIISPVSILDHGKMFVCTVAYHSGRILKSTTEVKVFVKPDISIALNKSFQGEAKFTCVVRKAFPQPNVLWFMDGDILKDKYEGIFIANEDTKVAGGFYEMRSLLTIWSKTIHHAFKCMSVYPFPGNETRNISSEEIILPYGGYQTPSLAFSEFSSQVTAVSDSPAERLQTMTSESLTSISQVPSVSDSSREKPRHSTKNQPDNTIAKLSSYSTVLQKLKDSTAATRTTSVRVTHLHESTTPPHRNLSTKRAAELTTPTSRDNSPTRKGWFNNTGPGTATIPKHIHFPWPGAVAALLFFCTFLIILGIRKWCQYQKEIMNRPPSFKPPPPPIKYTSMQVSDRTYPCCSELEDL